MRPHGEHNLPDCICGHSSWIAGSSPAKTNEGFVSSHQLTSPPHWRLPAPIRYHGGHDIRVPAHVPEKWAPVFRTGHAQTKRRIVMDAVTPKQTLADEPSHLVKPADMEWKPTRFPGCEVKTLLMDEKTGLMTALMRFAPGAVLPDHEHVNIEQTYVIEGRLVDKEGPAEGIEAKTGEFIWREPGSRHSAWCPEGGLMLAVFQVPNKFYEKDGRVTDPTGKIWDEVWGHTGKG